MVKKKCTLALFPLALCFSSAHVLAAATVADLEKRIAEQEKQLIRLDNRLKGTRSAVKETRDRVSEIQERLKINGFFSAGIAEADDDMNLVLYGIGDDYSTSSVNKMGVQFVFQVSDNVDFTGQLVSKGTRDYQVEAEWAYLSYRPVNSLSLRFGRQRIPYYLLSEYLDVGYAYPWVRPPIELYNIPISSTDGIGALYDFNLGNWNFTWQGYAGKSSGVSDQLNAEFILNDAWGSAFFAEVGDWTFRIGYNRSHLAVGELEAGGIAEQLIGAVNATNVGIAGIEATANAVPPGGVAWNVTLDRLNNDAEENSAKTEYKSAAFMYDNGSLLVMAEIANLKLEDIAFPAGDSGYITFGYRFGKWMPHVTYAKFYSDSAADQQSQVNRDRIAEAVGAAHKTAFIAALGGGATAVQANGIADATIAANAGLQEMLGFQDSLTITNSQQQSYTLGLTYDLTPRVKVKGEVAFYENFGSNSVATSYDQTLLGAPNAPTYSNVVTTTNYDRQVDGSGRFSSDGEGDKNTAIYSFSIDAVF